MGISEEQDADKDGLSNTDEIDFTKTNPYDFSSDGDPYLDGDEYHGLNLPPISSPGDHPLVAAYPDLSVRLTDITVTPLGLIESTTGGSKQSGWSITSEESDSVRSSFEYGFEQKGGCQGWSFVGELGAHQTWVSENTYTTTKSDSSSGWNQEDWSTATTIDRDKAAKLSFTFAVKNSGTIPAYEVTPYINIYLGNKPLGETIQFPFPIGTIGIGETIKNLTIEKGTSHGDAVEITVSLDELRAIDSGTPLSIETFQVDTSIDTKWDGNTWVKQKYDTYKNRINLNTVTLIHRSKDGTYKEYKVYPGNAKKLLDPITLGDAINLTIGSDILENGDERLEYGFFPQKAFDESRKLNNGNYLNLKLEPHWRILIKELGEETSPMPPVIHSAWVAKDLKTISASVTDDLGLFNVTAHVKIKGKDEYQNLEMKEYDRDTIYTAISKEEIDKDGDNYIKATDAEGSSAQFNLPIPTPAPLPKKPILKDGEYIIDAKNSSWYMTGANDRFRISQNYYNGGPNQIWILTSDKDGSYLIKNSQTGKYLVSKNVGSGVAVEQGQLTSTPIQNEKWNIEHNGDGYYNIYNIYSGKCLTFQKSADSPIVQYKHNDSDDNQKLMIQPAESFPTQNLLTFNPQVDYYLIIAEHSNKCLELSKSAIPHQWDYYGDKNQKWGLKPVGNGYFEIFNILNNNCLEVKDSTLSNNSDELQIVVENKYHGGDNQKWNFTYCPDGSYIIFSKNSGTCLTFDRAVDKNGQGTGNYANGAEVRLIEWDTGKDQEWKLLPVTKTAITAPGKTNNYYLSLAWKVYEKDIGLKPSEGKSNDRIFELISLGNDTVAIKHFDSYGFMQLVMLPLIVHHRGTYVDYELPVCKPTVGTRSFTEVLNGSYPTSPYKFKLDNTSESSTTKSIVWGDKYLLMFIKYVSKWDKIWGEKEELRLECCNWNCGEKDKECKNCRKGGNGHFTFVHQDY